MAEDKKDQKPAEPDPATEAVTPEAEQAAVDTAAEGGTQAQATQAAAAEEKQQRPERTDDEVKRDAKALVDELEARGLFEEATPAVPPAPEPASQPSGTDGAGSGNAGADDEKPRRRSFAEWFSGVR